MQNIERINNEYNVIDMYVYTTILYDILKQMYRKLHLKT